MSVKLLTLRTFLRLQFLNRLEYPLPHPLPVQVASIEQFIGPHGCVDRGVVSVLFDELGG